MYENVLAVVGNVVNDPVLRMTKSGAPFAAFRVASTPRRYDPATKAYEDGVTNFYNVTAFRTLAANVHRSIKKGQPVIVTGRLRVNQFIRGDGTPGTSVEIDAQAIGHDLTRGSATFTKSSGVIQLDETDRMSDPAIQAAHADDGSGLGPEDYDVLDPVTGEVADRRAIQPSAPVESVERPDGRPDDTDLEGSADIERPGEAETDGPSRKAGRAGIAAA